MDDYLFFLSYARDDKTAHLDDFVRDLKERLRVGSTHDAERLGFVDTAGIEAGDTWPDVLLEALQRSRVFVPLFTPRYFERPYCGKEWAVFEQRIDRLAEAQPGPRPPLILPVLWSFRDRLPRPLPDAVRDLQRSSLDAFGSTYASEGLYELLTRSVLRPEYEQFVNAFARRLLAVADEHGEALPRLPDPPPLREVPNPFAAGEGGADDAPSPDAGGGGGGTRGPKWVKFVYVAGNEEQIRALRPDLDAAKVYGAAGGAEWCPFYPEVEDVVLVTAAEVAAQAKFGPEGALAVDDALLDRIEEAYERRKIVVFVVDAWSLHLPDFAQRMQRIDQRSFFNCTVLVPWNLRDADTRAQRDALERHLRRTFLNWSSISPDRFVTSITSPEDFRERLADALAKTQGRILREAEPLRPVPADRVVPKPRIDAVGGSR